MNLSAEEPNPIKTKGPDIWPMVIKDMEDRNRKGKEKYGTPLQAFNGRKSLVDAYQEALDQVVYLRQEIEERGSDVAAKFGIERRMDELDVAKALSDELVGEAIIDILIELIRAESLHPVWPEDTLRQIAIMAGEAGEALQAGLHYAEGRGSLSAIRAELVQTGAMSLRALINLKDIH
jgi:hypothetical protein